VTKTQIQELGRLTISTNNPFCRPFNVSSAEATTLVSLPLDTLILTWSDAEIRNYMCFFEMKISNSPFELHIQEHARNGIQNCQPTKVPKHVPREPNIDGGISSQKKQRRQNMDTVPNRKTKNAKPEYLIPITQQTKSTSHPFQATMGSFPTFCSSTWSFRLIAIPLHH
jgi:hypothetical protein